MLRSIVFILAAFMGFLLRQVGIPIPYMLGGIFTAFCCKTFYEPHFTGSFYRVLTTSQRHAGHCWIWNRFPLHGRYHLPHGDRVPRRSGGLPQYALCITLCRFLYGTPHVCQFSQLRYGVSSRRTYADDAPDGRLSGCR